MSGLCDLYDFPEHERIAIAMAVRDSLLMPATAPVLLVASPPVLAVAGASTGEVP